MHRTKIPLSRRVALGCLVAMASFTLPAWADTIDRPTLVTDAPLDGSTEVTGSVTLDRGFPYHRYTAQTDGFVRFQMETSNLDSRPNDNDGVAWRPYLRIISVSNEHRHAEAWSSNGHQLDRSTGKAELVLRVRKGEQFDVITTLAQNFVRGRPDARAHYRLLVQEVSP